MKMKQLKSTLVIPKAFKSCIIFIENTMKQCFREKTSFLPYQKNNEFFLFQIKFCMLDFLLKERKKIINYGAFGVSKLMIKIPN